MFAERVIDTLYLIIVCLFLWERVYVFLISESETSMLFYLTVCYTQCAHVPLTALTVHLSYNPKEIDSVTLYSE